MTTTITKQADAVRPIKPQLDDEPQRPASWYVARTGNHQGLVIDETTGENIAVTYSKEHAPLVAAAPELLKACVELLREFASSTDRMKGNQNRAFEQALTAIAKAKGQ